MHTEHEFENIIEKELLQLSGYEQGNAKTTTQKPLFSPRKSLISSNKLNQKHGNI